MDECAFCGAKENLQEHHWLYIEDTELEEEWIVVLCVNCHQKIHPSHGVGRGRKYKKVVAWSLPIEREYRVRPQVKGKFGVAGKQVTLPPGWCRHHNIEWGDEVTVLADEVAVIIPPNMSSEDEEIVRKALGFEKVELRESKE